MARVGVLFDASTPEKGGAPLVCHHERLADPLDPFAKSIGRISSKRKKTESDHMEMARIEFVGGLYDDNVYSWLRSHFTANGKPGLSDADFALVSAEDPDADPSMGPYVPAWNMLRCLEEAAKRHKLGTTVKQALTIVQTRVPVQYDGPREIDALWFDGRFALRKTVGVNRRRVPRTRPVFPSWLLDAQFELDLALLDVDKLDQIAQEAGRWQGLNDMRPLYGRFTGSARLLDAKPKSKGKEAA